VIQGGYESARIVFDQIKRKIPVVVLRGTGGLADLIAFAVNEIDERSPHVWNAHFVDTFLKPELNIRIVNVFPVFNKNPLTRNIFRDRIIESVRI